MDRFEAMRVFVTVVDEGSFVAAADRLGLSKAVVSRQVAQLEHELGARLLHRTTRKLSLTSEGESFLARSREMLHQWQEASDAVSHKSGQARGVLRINVPVSFGISHLAPLWAQFMELHPQVVLDVTLSDRLIDLVEEGFDLAVRIGRLDASTLVSRRLDTTRLMACASPNYLRLHGQPVEPKDLLKHRVISYSLLTTGDVWSFTSTSTGERRDVRVIPVMRSNNGDSCREIAVQSQGIVLQPDFLIGEDIDQGRLVQIMPDWQAATLGIYAVYPSRRYLPAKVRLLIEFLADRLGAHDKTQGGVHNGTEVVRNDN